MARIDDDQNVSRDAKRIAGRKTANEYDPKVNSEPNVAKSYAERARERSKTRSAASIKGKAPPVGHVLPPDTDKMRAIAQMHGVPLAPKEEPPPQEPLKGVGAAYQVNQDVTRADRPLSMKDAQERAPSLSKETEEALRKAHAMAKPEETQEEPKKESEKEPEKEEESTSDAVDRAAEEALAEREIFGVDILGVQDARRKLTSKKRRKNIEDHLEPLDLSDLVMSGELIQTIEVIPGKLRMTFRTLSQRENMWIMKYLYDFPGSPLYLQELNATCRLACALVALNDQVLPEHREHVGEAEEDIPREDFERKLRVVSSYPIQLVADISVQHAWFQDRVSQLLTMDELKNG